MIQKINCINSISFQGIKRKPNNIDKQALVSNPIIKPEKNLPANPAHAVIKPALPTTYLNKSDISRYEKIQAEWAKGMAKKLGTSPKQITARLPKIRINKATDMVSHGFVGVFTFPDNVINMNPIRELANIIEGDEVIVVHESTHGLLHNLGRAYAHQIGESQLKQEVENIVLNKMLHGEHSEIFQQFIKKDSVYELKTMNAPILSSKEREAITQTIKSLQVEHKELNADNINSYQLSEKGKEFVKTTLMPQLNEYPKTKINNSEEEICNKIIDYINSFFTRSNYLFNKFISKDYEDLLENLKTPLTQKEIKMAKKTLEGTLSTYEGNFAKSDDASGIFEQSSKSYFMSFEERIAREEETRYRLAKINQKVNTIKAKGINPSESLIKEQQIIKNNRNLLILAAKLDAVEKKIITAQKDPQKLIELEKIKKYTLEEFKKIHDDPQLPEITKKTNIEEIKAAVKQKKSREEIIAIAKKNLTPEEAEIYDKACENEIKVQGLIGKFNELNNPDKLLAETKENNALKARFDNIFTKIKKLANQCDLLGIPKSFFENAVDWAEINEKPNNLFAKWAKKLSKVH